jgi:hypothetical protein
MARKDMYKEQGCSSGQLNEKIKEIAQRLYEKRGRVPGHELDDWLEAEKIAMKECQIGISTKCKK